MAHIKFLVGDSVKFVKNNNLYYGFIEEVKYSKLLFYFHYVTSFREEYWELERDFKISFNEKDLKTSRVILIEECLF
jgi:hypothetical protein